MSLVTPAFETRRHFLGAITKDPGSAYSSGREETTISSALLDREGDTIDPHGVDLTAFSRNGPVLFAHRSDELPVGQAERVWIDEHDNLRMRWRWLQNDPFADRVRNAWDQGILRGASVGFLPKKTRPNKHGGRHFDAWELCEVSLCAVPGNPMAVQALKTLGLWEDPRPSQLPSDFEITEDQLRAAPSIVRDCVAQVVGGQVRTMLGRLRGRVD